MGCDTVFALPATLDNTPTDVVSLPNLSVATRLTLYLKRLAPHLTLACPKLHASSRQSATLSSFQKILSLYRTRMCSGSTLHISQAECLHVRDVYVVFLVQIEVLFANGIDLHLYGICDTVQATRDIWHTSQQKDKRVGFQFPLAISALAPQYTNCSVLSCHVHQHRGMTRAKIEL